MRNNTAKAPVVARENEVKKLDDVISMLTRANALVSLVSLSIRDQIELDASVSPDTLCSMANVGEMAASLIQEANEMISGLEV